MLPGMGGVPPGMGPEGQERVPQEKQGGRALHSESHPCALASAVPTA